jgi:hypothetical protein
MMQRRTVGAGELRAAPGGSVRRQRYSHVRQARTAWGTTTMSGPDESERSELTAVGQCVLKQDSTTSQPPPRLPLGCLWLSIAGRPSPCGLHAFACGATGPECGNYGVLNNKVDGSWALRTGRLHTHKVGGTHSPSAHSTKPSQSSCRGHRYPTCERRRWRSRAISLA